MGELPVVKVTVNGRQLVKYMVDKETELTTLKTLVREMGKSVAWLAGGPAQGRAGRKTMTPEEYLKRPYSRCFVPVDGGFHSYIREFPGCLAIGSRLDEAYINLEEAAKEWIAAALDLGQEILEPRQSRLGKGEAMSSEQTVKCPICGRPYKVCAFYAGDQSACPKCRTEAMEQEKKLAVCLAIRAALETLEDK